APLRCSGAWRRACSGAAAAGWRGRLGERRRSAGAPARTEAPGIVWTEHTFRPRARGGCRIIGAVLRRAAVLSPEERRWGGNVGTFGPNDAECRVPGPAERYTSPTQPCPTSRRSSLS